MDSEILPDKSTPSREHSRWRWAAIMTPLILLGGVVGYVPFALMVGWDWPLAFVWHLPRSFFVGYDHGKAAAGVMKIIGSFFLVWLAYSLSRAATAQALARLESRVTGFTKVRCHIACILIVMGLAAVLREGYGTHIEDADPLRGGGEVVTDFEPSEADRARYGAEMFFAILIPALLGVATALDHAQTLEDTQYPKSRSLSDV